MQHCSCIVFLDGDRNSSVHKPDVTVAEIALLRAIHGPDAVEGIKPTYMGKEKPMQELARLRFAYMNSNVTKEGAPLVDAVYPGRAPLIPRTLDELGAAEPVDDDEGWDAPGYPPVPDAPEPQEPADQPQARNLGGRPRKETRQLTE